MIYEFDPVIYPTRIWVGIKTPFEEVKDKFYALDSDMEKGEITIDEYIPHRTVIARTYIVSEKDDKRYTGVLVVIWRPNKFDVKTVCHEAVHCTDFICEQFGIKTGDFDDGEAYAYLAGWVADCINKVRTNKFK